MRGEFGTFVFQRQKRILKVCTCYNYNYNYNKKEQTLYNCHCKVHLLPITSGTWRCFTKLEVRHLSDCPDIPPRVLQGLNGMLHSKIEVLFLKLKSKNPKSIHTGLRKSYSYCRPLPYPSSCTERSRSKPRQHDHSRSP